MKIQRWTEQEKLPSETGAYKLTADVALDETWKVDKKIALDLNGYGIRCAGCAIRVVEGGKLLLKDRGSKKPHFYTVKNSEIIHIGNPGDENAVSENADAGERTKFTGGYIFGASTADGQSGTKKAKACVQVEAGGEFSMKGGTILAGSAEGGSAVRIIRHVHKFSYSAVGNILTASCSDPDGCCSLPDHQATLTLAAPEKNAYGDGKSPNAALKGLDEFTESTGLEIAEGDIGYYEGDKKLDAAPEAAGTYTARLSAKGETVSVEYTIANADAAAVTGSKARRDIAYNGAKQARRNGKRRRITSQRRKRMAELAMKRQKNGNGP